MRAPIQIAYRNIEPTEALERAVRTRARKLERYYDGIIGCKVVLEAPHKRHHKGNHYRVLIALGVPGDELVVGRHPMKNGAHEDLYVVIRDAFAAAERELKTYVGRHRDLARAPGFAPRELQFAA
jgi:ribosome-associated translation inhibitor RaiA